MSWMKNFLFRLNGFSVPNADAWVVDRQIGWSVDVLISSGLDSHSSILL